METSGGLNLSYKLSTIIPTSDKSKNASMIWGLQQQTEAKQKFARYYDLSYELTLDEFFYNYTTPDGPGQQPVNNIPYAVSNKIALSYQALEKVRLQIAGSAKTSIHYEDQIDDLFTVSSGVTYTYDKEVSFDVGYRSAMRDIDLRDGRPEGTRRSGNSPPPVSDRLFDGRGSVIYLGTILRI